MAQSILLSLVPVCLSGIAPRVATMLSLPVRTVWSVLPLTRCVSAPVPVNKWLGVPMWEAL